MNPKSPEDFKVLIMKYLKYWYVFLISIADFFKKVSSFQH